MTSLKITSEEALEDLFDLLCEREHTNSEHTFWLKLYQEVKKDLEVLDCFLNCFKSAILDATDSQYRRGDNILADKLRDELGLITLNRLKERLKDE